MYFDRKYTNSNSIKLEKFREIYFIVYVPDLKCRKDTATFLNVVKLIIKYIHMRI